MEIDMINVIKTYSDFCKNKNIPFRLDEKISSYDDTTLFCPAGMQQFKKQFQDQSVISTQANIQSCLRLLDLDNAGDGTHLLYFDMIGLFSFRELTIKQAIDFWLEYLSTISIKPDYVTIHPDKMIDWAPLYQIEVRPDEGCIWTDGELSRYCTEFYVNNDKFSNLEIGNIVNICGDCIDVGFGKERLEMIVNPESKPLTELEVLKITIEKLLSEGYVPGNKLHGYVLRRLMRILRAKGGQIDNKFFHLECERQEKILQKYMKIKDKYPNKSKEWWFDTHGIDLN